MSADGAEISTILSPCKQLPAPPPASLRSGRQDEGERKNARPRGFLQSIQYASKTFVKFLSRLNTGKAEMRAPLSPPSPARSSSDPLGDSSDKSPFGSWRLKARSRSDSIGWQNRASFSRSLGKAAPAERLAVEESRRLRKSDVEIAPSPIAGRTGEADWSAA